MSGGRLQNAAEEQVARQRDAAGFNPVGAPRADARGHEPPGRVPGLVHARLFDWPDTALAGKTLTTPPGLPEDLRVAAPERAVLELLYEAGVKQSLEEARNLFDGLRSPRKDLLGQLLSCCASVKAVRLFLTWARETSLVDVDALLEQYPVRTGSNTRWMSRLDDGTLLSLRPHG